MQADGACKCTASREPLVTDWVKRALQAVPAEEHVPEGSRHETPANVCRFRDRSNLYREESEMNFYVIFPAFNRFCFVRRQESTAKYCSTYNSMSRTCLVYMPGVPARRWLYYTQCMAHLPCALLLTQPTQQRVLQTLFLLLPPRVTPPTISSC